MVIILSLWMRCLDILPRQIEETQEQSPQPDRCDPDETWNAFGKPFSDFDFLERLREYFKKLSVKKCKNPSLPESLPTEGPLLKFSEEEVSSALQQMKTGKAPGPDGISADRFKNKEDRPEICKKLTGIFNQFLEQQEIPSVWQKSFTSPVYKGQGSKDDCSNYRPIRLLCHGLKIFEKVLEARIREIVNISPNQYGYRKNCSSIDAIHAVRSLLQEHLRNSSPLHLVFLDIEKAFDSIPHSVIWYSLREHNVPESLIDAVKILYRNHETQVIQYENHKTRTPFDPSESFPITVGVHQGSALSPLLFIIVMDTITRPLQKPIPWTMLYADDVMLADTTREGLEAQIHQWKTRLEEFGLKLNIGKSGYLSTDIGSINTINVAGVYIKRTRFFKYLGSLIAEDGKMDLEIDHRISTYFAKWEELKNGEYWSKLKIVSDQEKARVYRTKIRPKLLYGLECWTLTKEMEAKVIEAEVKVLRKMIGVADSHPVNELLARYGLSSIANQISEQKIRWSKRIHLNSMVENKT